jgi:hypothetical protein
VSQSSDVRSAIWEQARSEQERRELEEIVRALDGLGEQIPYRPEFRAQLRQRLLREARRMRPWYRRKGLWTAATAVAAGIGAVVLFQAFDGGGTQRQPVQVPLAAQQAPAAPDPVQPTQVIAVTEFRPSQGQLVAAQYVLGRADLPDEWVGEGRKAGAWTAKISLQIDPSMSLPPVGTTESVYVILQVPPRPESLALRAERMGFRSGVAGSFGDLLTVAEGHRRLELHPDGRLVYEAGADGAAVPASDEAGATGAARRWLEEAGIAAPAGEPLVSRENGAWQVTFVPVFRNGFPAVTEAIRVWVVPTGHVVRATATTGQLEERGELPVITAEQAIQLLEGRPLEGLEGDAALTLTQMELVYARPTTLLPGAPLFLQPYWRATLQAGETTIRRYVPAIKPEYLR